MNNQHDPTRKHMADRAMETIANVSDVSNDNTIKYPKGVFELTGSLGFEKLN